MAKPSSSRRIAEQFINDQIAIMKKYGSEPHLTPERYKALLSSTRRSFDALKPRKEKSTALKT
jgi:hypothetical protein